MARMFSFKPALAMRGRKFKGVRGWAGKPLHPPLTDIPIAAYFLVGVMDVVSWLAADGGEISQKAFVAGTYTLLAGYIVSYPTIITGFWDWWKGMGRDSSTGVLGKATRTQAWRTANAHMLIMITVNLLVLGNLLTRSGDAFASTGQMIYSVVIALGVSIGATYGGSLVYDYGFNVETAGDHPVWHESEQDVFPGDK